MARSWCDVVKMSLQAVNTDYWDSASYDWSFICIVHWQENMQMSAHFSHNLPVCRLLDIFLRIQWMIDTF